MYILSSLDFRPLLSTYQRNDPYEYTRYSYLYRFNIRTPIPTYKDRVCDTADCIVQLALKDDISCFCYGANSSEQYSFPIDEEGIVFSCLLAVVQCLLLCNRFFTRLLQFHNLSICSHYSYLLKNN